MYQPNHSLPPDEGYLRLRDVLKVFPISRSAWWQGIRDGKYPRGIKLTERCTAWKVAEIRKLLDQPPGRN